MDEKFLSAYERMMQELEANGQVQVWDAKTTARLQRAVNAHMDAFDVEKEQKAAQSEQNASLVVLTA